ncbi:ABC transporter-like [Quillaja saponaria]|uniref:ABC transporter-like n=1 Tax=Quillaja saponaria TaxID=32244 RepID=A0AAD7LTT8_QUISA|nr:ABC transporter-like [Quillaja saponaria]
MAASNGSEYFEIGVESGNYEVFATASNAESVAQDEEDLEWAAIERLPSQHLKYYALLRRTGSEYNDRQREQNENTMEQIDVRKLNRFDRELVVKKALATNDQDNYRLLSAIKERLDRFPSTYSNFQISLSFLEIFNFTVHKKSGIITYNGSGINDFCVQRTSAYISQTDNHIAELTVRETLDFAARCQGASETFSGFLTDLGRLQKERNTQPSPEVDAFMKASSVGGKKHSVSTDYILKVLGLDLCSETVVGNDMLRGISGGQKKRVTTGEMVVGPRKTLFMDEISTGLDSSTTYQIVKCMRNFVHEKEATVLMALLQPSPEIFELFDDLVLLSEGHVAYQGPRADVLEFFVSLGFQLPPCKGIADFLQEVTSRKDQAQYWSDSSKPYVFLSVPEIAEAFRVLSKQYFDEWLHKGSPDLAVSSQSTELSPKSTGVGGRKKGMILPFQPLTMTFLNVNYFVDMPVEMKGLPETRLQLLSNVSGVFTPGVLTALVGPSGAGKTTLMDVLAGSKTGGYIEGDIRISGYTKKQRTFARISGYVEQNDIHSPQVTVEESLWFSSSLRLTKEVTKEKRHVSCCICMRHQNCSSSLSTEQRKRLTIAVELVANPSIIFMDEPTSGLDARAAAIVMRTVCNTVDTGRTVVCTIHQPSIDIFEAFDEGIRGIPPIPSGYNPATWVLEVTTPAAEGRISQDFAAIYRNSELYREVEASIRRYSEPSAGSEPVKFSSTYSKDLLSQFLLFLRKQNLVYWRSPPYHATRDSTQELFVVMGALYSACLFLGVNNSSSVQPIVSIERTVFYREKPAGMYSPYAYAAAQSSLSNCNLFLRSDLFSK